jgi:hypothetical protein
MENMRFLSRTRTLDHQFQVICCLMVTFKQEIPFSMSNLIGCQCTVDNCVKFTTHDAMATGVEYLLEPCVSFGS